ncbi:MAG: ribokinase [Deltaproteobacteria bacterium]|nr:ribokinase [Deltaproteobacteria bacterium]
MNREYDIFFFGHMCVDIIKTPSEESEMTSGPILFSLWTAYQLGLFVGALTKMSSDDRHRLKELPIPEEDIFWRESPETVLSILEYPTETMEQRNITNLKSATPYGIDDFPEFSAKLIHFCSLHMGEIDTGTLHAISQRAPVAIDVQGLLRKVFPGGTVQYAEWQEKMDILPLCRFFKADAAEAAFITGMDTEDHEGRVRAAERFLEWGAQEVVISHHTELVAANETGTVSAPLKNRNSSGRTGRGDTCFTSYMAERFSREPAEAVRFAAALTSLKLETPGPFKKNRKDIDAFLSAFYQK